MLFLLGLGCLLVLGCLLFDSGCYLCLLACMFYCLDVVWFAGGGCFALVWCLFVYI